MTAIGLTKAAHLYWRAQSVYQTPTTDFADHADALQAACTDLIGEPLNDLSTGAPAGGSGQTFSAADCSSVTAMIAAVELRRAPTQCNFQPLLQQNPPKVCGPNSTASITYRETFETAPRQAGAAEWLDGQQPGRLRGLARDELGLRLVAPGRPGRLGGIRRGPPDGQLRRRGGRRLGRDAAREPDRSSCLARRTGARG